MLRERILRKYKNHSLNIISDIDCGFIARAGNEIKATGCTVYENGKVVDGSLDERE